MRQPNEAILTPLLLTEIAEESQAQIEGVTFSFVWGDAEVLLWVTNTSIRCPKCEKLCKRCLVLKTSIGDIYACLNCNQFVKNETEEE